MKLDNDPRPYHQIYASAAEFINELKLEKGKATHILGDGFILNRPIGLFLQGECLRVEIEKAVDFIVDIFELIFPEFDEQEKRDFMSNVHLDNEIEYGKPVL